MPRFYSVMRAIRPIKPLGVHRTGNERSLKSGRPKFGRRKHRKESSKSLLMTAEKLIEEGTGLDPLVMFLTHAALVHPRAFLTLLGRILTADQKEAERAARST
jgi:hypothetical protein